MRPDLAAQAYGWDPSTVSAGSHKRLNWLCDKEHVWPAEVYARAAGNGCPICAGQQVLAGYNDLATTHPELGSQALGWDPTSVTAGSDKRLEWKCSQGHIWTAAINSRSRGHGCPFCAGQRAISGVNDFATLRPELAAQAHMWDPTSVTFQSNRRFEWICELGHVWSATASGRARGRGCPYCAGQRAIRGVSDLATVNCELASQAHGWDPTVVMPQSGKKLTWTCQRGHVWQAKVQNRTLGQGCPSCNEGGGFDSNKLGYLYLIEHVVEDMLQIGISNYPEQRLAAHTRRGWTPIEVQGPWNIGETAHEWEQSILRYLRSHGAIIAKDAGIEKFDGYKESWLRASFPVTSLRQLRGLVLDEEAEFEGKVA